MVGVRRQEASSASCFSAAAFAARAACFSWCSCAKSHRRAAAAAALPPLAAPRPSNVAGDARPDRDSDVSGLNVSPSVSFLTSSARLRSSRTRVSAPARSSRAATSSPPPAARSGDAKGRRAPPPGAGAEPDRCITGAADDGRARFTTGRNVAPAFCSACAASRCCSLRRTASCKR
jgi:hypothetical protein